LQSDPHPRNYAGVNGKKGSKVAALVLTIMVEAPLAVAFLTFSSQAAWVFPLSMPFGLVLPLVYAGVNRAEQENIGEETSWCWNRYIAALICSLPLGFLLAWLPEFGEPPGNLFSGLLGLITLPYAVPTVFALIWAVSSAITLRRSERRVKWQVTATVALLAIFIPAVGLDGVANYHIEKQRREQKAGDEAAAQRLHQERHALAKQLQHSGLNALSPPLTNFQQDALGDWLAGHLENDLTQTSNASLTDAARQYRDYPGILLKILEHPNCDESCSWAVYRSALDFEQAHPRQFIASIWQSLGQRENTPAALLEELATSNDLAKRRYAGGNKNLPPKARAKYLQAAANSDAEEERIFAAQQPDTPVPLLRKLATDKSSQYALLSNSSTPNDAIQEIVRNPMSPQIEQQAIQVLQERGVAR
jgi:hypothetical protein